jgi:tRNA/rRNA methyltransferase
MGQAEKTKVVLVEPAIPENTGMVLRSCYLFGISNIVLVNPGFKPEDDRVLKTAVQGRQLLKQVTVASSLEAAIANCGRVVATADRPLAEMPVKALAAFLPDPSDSHMALVFGREDNGLTRSELALCRELLIINTKKQPATFNLASAVSIVLWQLLGASEGLPDNEKSNDFIPTEERLALLQRFEGLLTAMPHSAVVRNKRLQQFKSVLMKFPEKQVYHLLNQMVGDQFTWLNITRGHKNVE